MSFIYLFFVHFPIIIKESEQKKWTNSTSIKILRGMEGVAEGKYIQSFY